MFLVKREESRDFDVFFWCMEEIKNIESSWAEGKFQKNVSSLSDGCLGLFIALGTKFKAAALVGSLESNLLRSG